MLRRVGVVKVILGIGCSPYSQSSKLVWIYLKFTSCGMVLSILNDVPGCVEKSDRELGIHRMCLKRTGFKVEEAQWPIGYGVGLRIKRSSVRIRPWPLC